MSTSLKVFFVVIIVLLLGLIIYLEYLLESKKLNYVANRTDLNSSQALEPFKVDESQAKEYKGEIFCIQDREKGGSLESCEDFGIIMEDGKLYELIELKFNSRVNTANYIEMEKVIILGVISPGESPFGLNGILNVFEIEKAATTSAQQAL